MGTCTKCPRSIQEAFENQPSALFHSDTFVGRDQISKKPPQSPHVPRLHVHLVVLQDGHVVPFLHVAVNFGPDKLKYSYVADTKVIAQPYAFLCNLLYYKTAPCKEHCLMTQTTLVHRLSCDLRLSKLFDVLACIKIPSINDLEKI